MIFTKWKRLFFLCCMLSSLHVLAEPKPDVVVWTSGSIDSVKALFSPDVNAVFLSREEEEKNERKAGWLAPVERDALFRKVGIETKVSGMDEFDKDILMMSAREYTISELKSEYPMITESQLKLLKLEMKKVK
jgi:hypothetical protein